MSSSELTSAVEEATIALDYPIYGDMETSLFLMIKGIKPFATMLLSGEASDEILGGYKQIHNDSLYPGIPNSTAANYELLLKNDVKFTLRLKEKEVEAYHDLVKDCPQPHTEIKTTESKFRERMYIQLKYKLGFMFERLVFRPFLFL